MNQLYGGLAKQPARVGVNAGMHRITAEHAGFLFCLDFPCFLSFIKERKKLRILGAVSKVSIYFLHEGSGFLINLVIPAALLTEWLPNRFRMRSTAR